MKKVFLNLKLKCVVHQKLDKISRVIISIGHDPLSKGATNKGGDVENSLCQKIAWLVEDYLNINQVNSLLMPDLSLKETIRYLNANGNETTDLAIEIHKDAVGDKYNDATMRRRVGLYYMRDGIGGTLRIAGAMVKTMQDMGAHATSWIRPDTDSNHGSLGFCRKTKMLAMVAELGFIEGSNDADENEWYAWALTKAILDVLEKPVLAVPVNFTTIMPVV